MITKECQCVECGQIFETKKKVVEHLKNEHRYKNRHLKRGYVVTDITRHFSGKVKLRASELGGLET